MDVRLISYTGSPDAVCNMAAEVCISKDAPEVLDISTNGCRHLRAAMRSGHDSVLEHASVSFMVSGISRACSHQLVRHRLASYCVSGKTKIRTSSQKTNGKTICELFNLKPQYFEKLKVRCVDEGGNIRYNHPDMIVCSGIKPTYTVKTIHGYTIRTTKEHQFLTEVGWKSLEDIEVGERVYINGQESYKDKDWLYQKYHIENLSQQEIADLCGVSKGCIRSWIRKHGIQKEMGSWAIGIAPPNKGRSKSDYEPLMRVSEKMRGNHNPYMYKRGAEKHGSWKDEGVSESGLRSRTARAMYPLRTNICSLCGFQGVTEFHHINHDLEEYDTNIMELCVSCHKAIHRREITQRIVLSEVTSIEFYGDEMTYDIMMPNPYHNFIADGFVVHNSQQSQRFVDMSETHFTRPGSFLTCGSTYELEEGVEATTIGYTWECAAAMDVRYYREALKEGVPKEDARYLLPEACTTNIMVTMNLRELRHFLGLRLCTRAQWEIRELAERMFELVKDVAPICAEYMGPQCEVKGYCPESRSCGRHPTMVELRDAWGNRPLKDKGGAELFVCEVKGPDEE